MGRRLVIFADGTGNAFSTQESNIWRLYNALDRSDPDQVARYIRGVGTSGFRPFAMLDGATGIGVPSNVRELYRFLCWNWREGDEIHMFGFSRGAFTIRTLVGLIHHEGLVPAQVDGRRVASDEMARNTRAAWRSYRAKSFPAAWWQPQIRLVRGLRDAAAGAWNRLRHQPGYAAVAAETRSQGRDQVRIRYVGLFDTVEAFGVPFDELGTAIDVALWPISFRNQVLSAKVDSARHALSLDDDRRTFHPVRFDRSDGGCRDIEEVWFAGAHSDVGGGYPDGELSLVPLAWIAEGASRAGLRFDAGAIPALQTQASAFGPRHDPRRGGAMFYRYAPRPIGEEAKWGGPPVVDGAVAHRMLDGNDGYAPLTLPTTAQLRAPGGGTVPVAACDPAVRADGEMLAFAQDAIWWRRALYFLRLALAVTLAFLPITAPWIATRLAWLVGQGGVAGKAYAEADRGMAATLGSLQGVLENVVPSYAVAWLNATVAHPLPTLGLVVLFWLAGKRDAVLRDAARDCARAAWFPAPAMKASAAGSRSLRLARALRTSAWAPRAFGVVPKYILPGLLVLGLFLGAGVTASRVMVTWLSASEGAPLCVATKDAAPLAEGRQVRRDGANGFDARALCWASGVTLEKGQHYTLWIDEAAPFRDDKTPSGVGGFRVEAWWSIHTLGLPIRRWWNAEWFQPIARIGAAGNTEWPLLSMDRLEVPPQGREPLDRRLVARFQAKESGELFLYLNDAIYWLPSGWRSGIGQGFYINNHGRASVTIRRDALPQP